jgi:hypothetical protein
MTITRHKSLTREEMASKIRLYRNSDVKIHYSISRSGSRSLSVIRPGSDRHYYADRKGA